MYDVIVIGCGPAGLSAAVNVRQRGGRVAVVGLDPQGSGLWKAERIDNYLGLPGKSGKQLLEIFEQHARESGAEFVRERVLSAMDTGQGWMVSAGADVLEAYSIVFAGGITRGKAYPGEEEFLGKGVSYCATCDGMLYRNRPVAVIGFSDADEQEAQYLEGIGCKVQYYEKPSRVEILGEKAVNAVTVDGKTSPVSCVFVLRPALAPTSLFPGLKMDGRYIETDKNMATNLPGLFAAGDCTGGPSQVAKAVGEGLIAGQKAMAHAAAVKAKNQS